MSASDFNKLLDEKHEGDNHVKAPQRAELYDEYIKLHLPDERIGGEPTNKLEDGVQLGAIYIVEYDDDNDRVNDDGYWFVVGYTDEWGLEMFYGECSGNRITSKGLTVWKGLRDYSPPQNNIITDSSTLRRILKFFIGSADGEIFIAYSPHPYSLYPSNSRTLNFSKRGFMQ
jgi:hypothetical protein